MDTISFNKNEIARIANDVPGFKSGDLVRIINISSFRQRNIGAPINIIDRKLYDVEKLNDHSISIGNLINYNLIKLSPLELLALEEEIDVLL